MKDDDATARQDGDVPGLEWPDDGVDARDQEQENEAALNAQAPVSRAVAALVLGILIVQLFVLPLSVAAGTIGFFIAVCAPIALGGLIVGFPTGVLLDRVARGLPRGVGEIAFVALGGAIGYGLTWAGLTLLQEQLFADAGQLTAVRAQASVFMLTATAAGFLGAYMLADRLRRHPKQVWILGAFVAVLTVLSVIANLFGGGA